jgi:hypothetical protein
MPGIWSGTNGISGFRGVFWKGRFLPHRAGSNSGLRLDRHRFAAPVDDVPAGRQVIPTSLGADSQRENKRRYDDPFHW